MKEILIYALGVVVCSGVFTAFYRTVMHQRTGFRTARAFLVGSMVVAAVIPAFDIPVWRSEPVVLPAFDITALSSPTVAGGAEVTIQKIEVLPLILLCLYVLGIATLITLMIVQAAKIHRTKRRAEVYATPGYQVAVSAEVESPFSFLQTVYVTQGTPPSEMQQIVLHEASHIRHRHSVEKIFMETLKTLLWFNPFAWITARLLNEVQEFEADRDVLLGGCTVEEYLPVIFRQVFGYAPEISTALNHSLTKKRFEMMTKKFKQTRHSWLRTVGAVPLVAAMMMLFGFTHHAPEVVTQKPETTDTTTVTVVGYGTKRKPETTTVTVGGDGVKGFTIRSRNGESDKEVTDYSNIIIWLVNENKEITAEEMRAIDPYTIESISVLREAAMKPYLDKTGKESADGVISIALKSDDSQASVTIQNSVKFKDFVTISRKGGEPDVTHKLDDKLFYWLVNENKEISADEMNAIDINSVEELSVLKEESAYPAEIRRAMGDRKFDGAVLIELKAIEVVAVTMRLAEDVPMYVAEEMPTFEGGDLNNFRNWVYGKIIYPKAAMEKKIQGKVTLKFVIERDGSVSNIEILSSPDQLLSDEAIRVMKLSPKWTPGKQEGKPARVYYILPVDFALSGK
jgi:TonB family protein